MKVLHLSPGKLFGGIETLLVTLARHRNLCPGLEPHFGLCFEGRLASELRSASAPVHLLGAARVSRPWTVWRVRRRLGRLLHRHRFDLVVCHSAWPQAIFGPVVRRYGLPLVFWLHGAADGRHWLERWASRTPPDLALANSRFTAGTLPHLYPQAPTHWLYCPVTAPGSPREIGARAALRAEWNTPEDAVVIVQVSRLEECKGHTLHLEALGRLRGLPKWVCWQIGGVQTPGEALYMERLKQAAARLGIAGRLRFAGHQRDVAKFLAAADVFCQPNTSPDSFGIAFVEALLAGLPVITTAMGGGQEVVDSTCGVLVPPDNPAALADALRSLIEEPGRRARLGAYGPGRARTLCDPAAQMERLNELLIHVIRQKTAGQEMCPGHRGAA